MAISDVLKEFDRLDGSECANSPNQAVFKYDTNVANLVQGILKLVQDEHNEVQTLAIKWYVAEFLRSFDLPLILVSLLPLVRRVEDGGQVQLIVGTLCDFLAREEGSVRDVAAMGRCFVQYPEVLWFQLRSGLKLLLGEIKAKSTSAAAICAKLVPYLIQALGSVSETSVVPNVQKRSDVTLDELDILSDLLGRFGKHQTILTDATPTLQTSLLALLNSGRSGIRKRAVTALGLLTHTSTPALTDLLAKRVLGLLMDQQEENGSLSSSDMLTTYISTVVALIREQPEMMATYLDRVTELFARCVTVDDDHTREAGLNGLEVILAIYHPKLGPENIFSSIAIEYMKYDPNYIIDDGGCLSMELDNEFAGLVAIFIFQQC